MHYVYIYELFRLFILSIVIYLFTYNTGNYKDYVYNISENIVSISNNQKYFRMI